MPSSSPFSAAADPFDAEPFDVAVPGAVVHGRTSGSGPPVLLLHGIPETHLMWRRIAAALAEHHTVVCTDLRGHGRSIATDPDPDPETEGWSMRALARDQREVMARLGHDRFSVVGHDRGGRCAYRLALDHPDAVECLGVLDIVPTAEAFARADAEFALGFWVWSFLAAPAPVPERLIAGAPDTLVDHMLDTWSADPGVFTDDVRAAYRAPFHDPATGCPVLALWSGAGPVAQWYDPLAVWRRWADDVRGGPVEGGHFLPEEAPGPTLAALRAFLDGRPIPPP
jgi:haloacetate dehalogenase